MRWIFRVFFGLLALIVVGVAVLLLLPGERIAGVLTDRFEAATGRQMTIAGDVRPSVWPTLGARIEQVSIANADWTDGQPMVSAESVSVGVDLMAILGGEVRIKEVALISPRIRLEKGANGQTNWTFDTGGGTADGGTSSGGIPAFSLDQGSVRDGQITYFDRALGDAMVLSEADIDLSLPDFNGPMEVALKGRLNGEPIETDLTIESLSDLLAGNGRTIGGALSIGTSSATFGGLVDLDPVSAAMDIDATLTDLAQLFRAIGQQPPNLPSGIGERISVKGKVTFADGDKIFLRDGVLNLDGNALSGEADLVIAEKPKITGRFRGGNLNFARLLTGSDSGGGGNAVPGWSKDRIDVSGLAAIDADIALSADSINLGLMNFGATRTVARLTDRRLVFELQEVLAYGGRTTGEFVVNGRGGLSTGGSLAVRGIEVQPLLRDLADYERLLGQVDLDFKFLGVGNSIDAIMQGLKGSGAFKVGKGELRGLDIAGMIRNLDPGYVGDGQKTIFDQIGATFTITDGVLSNDDLTFLAPLLTATGKGTVGIGAQNIDYRLLPVALPGADGQGGLKVPLKITGTWADPSFGLDLQALADQELAEEKEALKAAAKAAEERAKAKVEEALGVDTQEGESLEDAAKRKLEEEAKKGLLKLLGADE